MSFSGLIIIPAYNEEKNLERLLPQIPKEQPVIIVSDGSTDNTAEVCERYGYACIIHPSNLGYEQAVSSGIKYFKETIYHAFVILDADGEISVESCLQVLSSVNNDFRLCCGYRTMHKGRFSEVMCSFLPKLLFGLNDVFCGCKAIHRDIVMNTDEKEITKYAFSCFAMRYAKRNKVKNIPIKGTKRMGASRYGTGVRTELKIIKTFLMSFYEANFTKI
jgi:glycosyltransferase involved in cell wall biosynthesis